MAFARPTLPEILERIQSDIDSRLEGTDPRLRRAVLFVLGRTLTGASHGLHGHLDWLGEQVVPDRSERDILIRYADWWGIPLRLATAASGPVTIAGTEGAVLPAGKTWQRSDGIEYTTVASATINGGTATVQVTATTTGQVTNAVEGVTLNLTSPASGIQSAATVTAGGLTGGADDESTDSLRERLRARVQRPPHGGSKADYIAWALEVPGVTRAWCIPQYTGAGTVAVFFVRDDDEDFIPTATLVQAVQDYIDELRPVTAQFTAYAPTPLPVNMTIQLTPNTADVRAAVTAELEDLFLREAAVEDGSGSGKLPISHIREAISRAEGEQDHKLVGLAAEITPATGEIAVLGTLTFEAQP